MKKLFFLFNTILFALLLSGCGSAAVGNTVISGFYFDTVVSITVYGDMEVSTEEAERRIREKLEEEELVFSPTKEEAVLAAFNASGEELLKDAELCETLMRAEEFYELSGGAADPTIGSVSILWDFHGGEKMPDEALIEEGLRHCGMKDVLEFTGEGYVRRKDKDTVIDLGFIAKGRIADELKVMMTEELGVSSAVINLGGNVTLIGCKPGGKPFKVGIQKPFAEGENICVIGAEDTSVVTSGVYQRCFEKDGKLYHHILDPATGYPAESGLQAVTVVCEDAAAADALSTACMVMGKDKGMELIGAYPGAEALFIDDKGQQYVTEGFPERTI